MCTSVRDLPEWDAADDVPFDVCTRGYAFSERHGLV